VDTGKVACGRTVKAIIDAAAFLHTGIAVILFSAANLESGAPVSAWLGALRGYCFLAGVALLFVDAVRFPLARHRREARGPSCFLSERY
jgi:hypothetical protein